MDSLEEVRVIIASRLRNLSCWSVTLFCNLSDISSWGYLISVLWSACSCSMLFVEVCLDSSSLNICSSLMISILSPSVLAISEYIISTCSFGTAMIESSWETVASMLFCKSSFFSMTSSEWCSIPWTCSNWTAIAALSSEFFSPGLRLCRITWWQSFISCSLLLRVPFSSLHPTRFDCTASICNRCDLMADSFSDIIPSITLILVWWSPDSLSKISIPICFACNSSFSCWIFMMPSSFSAFILPKSNCSSWALIFCVSMTESFSWRIVWRQRSFVSLLFTAFCNSSVAFCFAFWWSLTESNSLLRDSISFSDFVKESWMVSTCLSWDMVVPMFSEIFSSNICVREWWFSESFSSRLIIWEICS